MDLYQKYHAGRDDERLQLFQIARSELSVDSGLYPGCFVHVTPSFVIPRMVYVDSDARAKKFFGDGTADEIVNARRYYEEASRIEFVHQDYSLPLPIEDNSHGDAGLAHSDQYFIAKTQSLPSDPQALRDYLKDLGRGVGYTTTASDYVFRKRG